MPHRELDALGGRVEEPDYYFYFFWLFSELVPVLRKKNGMFFICRLEIRPFKGVDCPNDARFFNRGSLKNHDDSR